VVYATLQHGVDDPGRYNEWPDAPCGGHAFPVLRDDAPVMHATAAVRVARPSMPGEETVFWMSITTTGAESYPPIPRLHRRDPCLA
jgi:hypothetical protein